MVDAVKPILTITGVSGFLGSYVCLEFLKCGDYHVRGTVRDTKNEARIAPLRKAFGAYFDKLELVEADLLDPDSLTRAIAGSTYVVHTASPVSFSLAEDDIVKPALEGTMAVVKACAAFNVKRCVITSSCATIYHPRDEEKPDYATGWLDESCWSDPDRPGGVSAYVKSKTLAERAAWDFQKSLPEDKRFELVTVQPCFIQGPTLLPGSYESGDYVAAFFNGNFSSFSYFNGGRGIVDIRDVAKIHVEAIRKPEAANQRFIAYSRWVRDQDMAAALKAEFGPKGFNVITDIPAGTARDPRVSSKKSREFFGIDFISAKESVIAMANSLIELGVIK